MQRNHKSIKRLLIYVADELKYLALFIPKDQTKAKENLSLIVPASVFSQISCASSTVDLDVRFATICVALYLPQQDLIGCLNHHRETNVKSHTFYLVWELAI